MQRLHSLDVTAYPSDSNYILLPMEARVESNTPVFADVLTALYPITYRSFLKPGCIHLPSQLYAKEGLQGDSATYKLKLVSTPTAIMNVASEIDLRIEDFIFMGESAPYDINREDLLKYLRTFLVSYQDYKLRAAQELMIPWSGGHLLVTVASVTGLDGQQEPYHYCNEQSHIAVSKSIFCADSIQLLDGDQQKKACKVSKPIEFDQAKFFLFSDYNDLVKRFMQFVQHVRRDGPSPRYVFSVMGSAQTGKSSMALYLASLSRCHAVVIKPEDVATRSISDCLEYIDGQLEELSSHRSGVLILDDIDHLMQCYKGSAKLAAKLKAIMQPNRSYEHKLVVVVTASSFDALKRLGLQEYIDGEISLKKIYYEHMCSAFPLLKGLAERLGYTCSKHSRFARHYTISPSTDYRVLDTTMGRLVKDMHRYCYQHGNKLDIDGFWDEMIMPRIKAENAKIVVSPVSLFKASAEPDSPEPEEYDPKYFDQPSY